MSSVNRDLVIPENNPSGLVEDWEREHQDPLWNFFRVLLRHKTKAFLVFLLISGSIAISTLLAPNIYESEAKVLSRVGRENLAMDPSVVGPTIGVSQSRESDINSELAILKSRYLLEKVVDKSGPERILGQTTKSVGEPLASRPSLLVKLGLAPPLSAREKAIKKLMKNLNFEVEGKSNIISLSLQSKDAVIARKALADLLGLYLQRHIEVYRTQAPPQFFEQQLSKLSKRLQEKEDELKGLRSRYNIAAIDKQKDLMLSQVSALESGIADTTGRISASQAKIASYNDILKKGKVQSELSQTKGKTNYAADELKRLLAGLRQQEADLAGRYKGNYQPLLIVREQIKQAQESLSEEKETHTEVTTGLNTNYQSILLALDSERAELQAQIAQKEALTREYAKQQAALDTLSSHELTLARLQRDVGILESDYVKYHDNLQRAMVTNALDVGKVSNVSIVQPATTPLGPIKPRKLFNLAVGFILGIFGAMVTAFVVEYLGNSLRMENQARGELRPILAAVPYGDSKGSISRLGENSHAQDDRPPVASGTQPD